MRDVSQRSTVVGVFRDRPAAERALEHLRDAGFRDDQIGILSRGDETSGAETSGGDATTSSESSKVGEGAAAGAVIGGILGAGAALLIPGIGPVLAGGILAGVLGTAAIGAAAGGVIGALVGLGVPEEEARYYEGEFKSGRTLVTVKAGDRYDEARELLRRDGAYDVRDEGGSETAIGRETSTDRDATRGRAMSGETTTSRGQTGEMRVPVSEEKLVTGTRREQAGEVVVSKDVVEEERSVDVPVRHQEVTIERRRVDRDLGTGERAFEGETSREVRVPVYEEKVDVEKQAHVSEELVVKPREVTQQQNVTETVRREVPRVETTGDAADLVQGAERVSGQSSRSSVRPWSEVMPTYRSQWQSRYGSTGGRWEDTESAYRFGYESYNDPQYKSRDWTTVEPDLRRSWEARGGSSAWDRVKDHIRSFWERSTGNA